MEVISAEMEHCASVVTIFCGPRDKTWDKSSGYDLLNIRTSPNQIRTSSRNTRLIFQLLYRNIDLIEKKLNTQSPGGSIILKCKDFRILQLDINSVDDLMSVILSIEKLTSQGTPCSLNYNCLCKP